MLTVLNRIAGLVPPLLYAGALAALILAVGVQSARLSSALTDAAKLQAGLSQCVQANTTADAAIASLTAANGACLAGRRADRERYVAAGAAWVETEKRLNAEAEQIADEQNRIYNNVDCKKLGEVSITRACPAIGERLRKQARGYYRN